MLRPQHVVSQETLDPILPILCPATASLNVRRNQNFRIQISESKFPFDEFKLLILKIPHSKVSKCALPS